jgi:holo-[acyl-carrier protein] synthase
MTIVGIGLDATDIPRIAAAIERYGDRFLSRILTPDELAYCLRRRDPTPHVAGRFAAKEAGMKAIGTGHSRGVLWRDIEVVRRGGPPQLRFHGAASEHFTRLGADRALLTITHAQTLAIAHVILVGR